MDFYNYLRIFGALLFLVIVILILTGGTVNFNLKSVRKRFFLVGFISSDIKGSRFDGSIYFEWSGARYPPQSWIKHHIYRLNKGVKESDVIAIQTIHEFPCEEDYKAYIS